MILKARKIITGDAKTVIENGALAVDNGKIAGVDTFENISRQFAGEEVVDYGDATITPGLADMHVHVANLQLPIPFCVPGVELA